MDVLWKENNVLYNVLCVLITENEKLFDRSDAKLYWTTVFHMLTVLHHGYVGLCAAAINIDIEVEEIQILKKYKVAYLTGWNFSFQIVFLCLALMYDILQWLDKHERNLGKKTRYFRDIIFNGLVFPFTCFVTGTFWGLYLIDRELVFSEVYDQIVPWWLNHCVHTNIFIVIAIETILTKRWQPTDGKTELYMYAFILVSYTVICDSIYLFDGVWLYGVFGVITWWQVCIYQSVNTFMGVVFYRTAFIINRMIHKEEDGRVVRKDSKAANGGFWSKETTFNSCKNVGNIKNGATSEVADDSNKPGNNLETNRTKDLKEGKEDSVKGNTDVPLSNGNLENYKKFKSITTNIMNKDDEFGALHHTIDKSSTKYRKNRKQCEKSSL